MPLQITSLSTKLAQSAPLGLPASTTGTLFTVSGGPVWVVGIFGFVTTVIQAQATTFKISGKSGALTAVDICATGDLNGLAVGTLVMPVTTFATALAVAATNGVQIAVPITAPPMSWIQNTGTIIGTTVATSTGAIQWSCVYLPLAPGASIA